MELEPRRTPLAYRAALLLLCGGLYAITAAEAVQPGEAGELIVTACQAAGPEPEVARSALGSWLGAALCKLPWSTPAARIGALSLTASLCALFALFAALRGLGARSFSALAAALSVATGPLLWREASQASLVSLQLAASLGAIWALVRSLRATGDGAGTGAVWRVLAGLCLGLAVDLDPSALLLVPLALASATVGLRGPLRLAKGALAVGVGLLCGLAPILAWRGGAFWEALSAWPVASTEAPQALGRYLASAAAHQSWLLWPFALVGLVLLAARASGRPLGRGLSQELGRGLAATLVALPLLAGPLRALLVGDPWSEDGRAWVLAHGLLAIPLGLGLSSLQARLQLGADRALARSAAVAALAAIAAAAIFWAYPRANLGARFHAEDWARNSLASLERGALLVGGTRGQRACLLYAQRLLGIRPDVQLVAPELLSSSSYLAERRRERPGFGRFVEAGRGLDQTLRLIQAEQRRGVPVYLADASQPRVLAAFASYPVGALTRLLPPGSPLPDAEQLYAENERLYRGFLRRGGPPDREHDPEAARLAERHAASWRLVASALYQTGDRPKALRALVRAQEHAPWQPVPDWFGPRRLTRPARGLRP